MKVVALTHTTTTPPGSAFTGLNPITLLWHVFYNIANGVTQIVGLTPVQFVAGVGGLLLVGVLAQLVMVLTGRQGWHLNDVRDDAAVAEKIRADLDR